LQRGLVLLLLLVQRVLLQVRQRSGSGILLQKVADSSSGSSSRLVTFCCTLARL
jgi:hypothetical protein